MNKIKIQDLEVGKVYRFYDNDDESLSESIYMIDEQGDLYWSESLFEENQNDFLKSALTYNEVKNNYFVEIKKKIDWTKIPQGTKVQVRDYEGDKWRNGYFYKYKEGSDFPFKITEFKEDDSFVGIKLEDNYVSWEQCRLYEDVEVQEDWYK